MLGGEIAADAARRRAETDGVERARQGESRERRLAPGLWQIDTLLGGWPEVNAVFLLEGESPCLVETGPQLDAPVVVAALARRGLGPEDLAWVVVTHVHLDHAGAVGEIAGAFPSARIVAHERGVRHLADPTRLVEAAGRVYGERLDSLYGRMTPVPPERLQAAADQEVIELGAGRRLRLIESPGHAKHHLAVLDESSGALLVGDAVGVQIPGGEALRPATPPDDFDLGRALGSLRRFAQLGPEQVVLTHYGPAGPPDQVLAESERQLHLWSEIAREAYREEASVDHLEEALRARIRPRQRALPERLAAVQLLTGWRSNAAGLWGWLERERRAGEAGSGPARGGSRA